MKKICFLLGAGADSSIGIGTGMDFAKAVLGLEVFDKYDSAIKDYYKELNNDWYPKYKSTKWKANDLFKAAVKKYYLSKENNENKTIDELINEGDGKQYSLLDGKYKDYCGYMGIIDEAFHTLIYPRILGPNKFWRVIISYIRAYLFILENCNCLQGETDFEKIHTALATPNKCYKLLEEYAKTINVDNYYEVLKNYKNSIRIVTTNYTPFCECIVEPNEEVAYIHGKLCLFENPRTLEIIDISNKADGFDMNDVYFPYISIQSGIKPIIDSTQIKAYKKMLDYYDESDIIAVLGYQFNPDDNHLNSIIREQIIKNNKKLVYFDYNDNNEISREQLCTKLRIFGEKQNNISIDIIHINESNCIESFKIFMENI